jgi:hypothetical protein
VKRLGPEAFQFFELRARPFLFRLRHRGRLLASVLSLEAGGQMR